VSFVDLPGNVEHGPVGLETLDLRVGRVDGEDLSRIALERMFARTTAPSFPGVAEAPTTAMDFGRRRASRRARRFPAIAEDSKNT